MNIEAATTTDLPIKSKIKELKHFSGLNKADGSKIKKSFVECSLSNNFEFNNDLDYCLVYVEAVLGN